MKRSHGLLAVLTLVAMVCAQTASAQAPSTFYVSPDGSGSQNGLSWANTMAGIQAGIDASSSNWLSVVWVADGVYDTGSQTGHPSPSDTVSNRVAIWKPITVRSLSGPGATFIVGASASGGTNGPGATRCVYMTNNASLIGFTLTNGYTEAVHVVPNSSLQGGGVYSGYENIAAQNTMISNCVLVGNQSWYHGGGAAWGTLYDCTIIFNTAGKDYVGACGGGGTWRTDLYRCQVISNQVRGTGTSNGGGSGGYSLTERYNCYIAGNTAGTPTSGNNPNGGGTYNGWLYDCTVVVNRAVAITAQSYGGGCGSTELPSTDYGGGRLFNCVVSGNTADHAAGVGRNAWASNCMITANSGRDSAAEGSVLIDCTISYNKHRRSAAVNVSALRNCVIVSNILDNYGLNNEAGGASNCSLTNCLVAGNSTEGTTWGAGGIWRSRALSCTIVDNSGAVAGGVMACILTNCITWDNNIADIGATNYYSCSSNAASHGVDGNITNNPLFEDSGAGNYTLGKTSPCINAGTNLLFAGTNQSPSWMVDGLDLAGEMRIREGRVDMGAYEAPPPIGTVLMVQ